MLGRQEPILKTLSTLELLPTDILFNICKFINPQYVITNMSTISQTLHFKLQECGIGSVRTFYGNRNTENNFYALKTEEQSINNELLLMARRQTYTLKHFDGVSYLGRLPPVCLTDTLNMLNKLNIKEVVLANLPDIYFRKPYMTFLQQNSVEVVTMIGCSQAMLYEHHTLPTIKTLILRDINNDATSAARDAIIDGSFYSQFPNLKVLHLAEFPKTSNFTDVHIWKCMPLRFAENLTTLSIFDNVENNLASFPLNNLSNMANLTICMYDVTNDKSRMLNHLTKLSKLHKLKTLSIFALKYPDVDDLLSILETFNSKMLADLNLSTHCKHREVMLNVLRKTFHSLRIMTTTVWKHHD